MIGTIGSDPAKIVSAKPSRAITRRSLQSLLLMLQVDFEKSILMITHDIEEALRLADEVLVLSGRPMRILDQFSLNGPKPRRLADPELIKIKDHVLNVLQRELHMEHKLHFFEAHMDRMQLDRQNPVQ